MSKLIYRKRMIIMLKAVYGADLLIFIDFLFFHFKSLEFLCLTFYLARRMSCRDIEVSAILLNFVRG